MIREFAINPQLVENGYHFFKIFLDHFCFQNGRMISRLPKKWEKAVIKAARDSDELKDREIARLVEKLKELKSTSFALDQRNWDTSKTWDENANLENARQPFQAILSSSKSTFCSANAIGIDDFDMNHPLLKANNPFDVPRSNEGLLNAIKPMLKLTTSLTYIDPWFNLVKSTYVDPLVQILKFLSSHGKSTVKVTIHAKFDVIFDLSVLEANFSRIFDFRIPEGVTFEIYEWSEQTFLGEDLHNRFLLMDYGGLTSGAGFEAVGGHQSDTITLFDRAFAEDKRSQFLPENKVFVLKQGPLFVDHTGSVSLNP